YGTDTAPAGPTVNPPGDQTPQTPPAPVVPPEVTPPPTQPVPGLPAGIRRGPPPWNKNYVPPPDATQAEPDSGLPGPVDGG
ncbi:MAG: hypothetical protein AB1510_12665, partial [Bacillota bacterium]